MKALLILVLVTAIGITAADKKPAAEENRVKIGILTLEQFDRATDIADKIQFDLVSMIKDIGFYQCFEQKKLENALAELKQKFPRHCRDPRCVLDIGKSTGMDRMLFGSMEWGYNRFGVRLTLIDVLTRQTIESVKLKGAEGVKPQEVLRAAVKKLHGQAIDDAVMEQYYGPEVFNKKEWLITSAATIGLGILYSSINYGVEQDVSRISATYTDEELSGFSTTNIPLFARPAALANAYVAASDDAYGVLFNPAGIAWIRGPEAVLAYQYRFGLDNFAATYVNKATREIGFGQALLYRSDRDQLMTEMYFVSAFAYKFHKLPSYIRPFSLGANLKIIGNRVKSTSDISSGGSSIGVGLDMGLIWELSDVIRYGLMFKDLPVLNYWKNVKTGERYYEASPTSLMMGGTFQAGYSTFLIAEGYIPLYEDQPWKMAGGIEQEFFRLFKLRVGIQREIMAAYKTDWKLTGGFGLKFDTEQWSGKYISLDGSYEYNTLQVFNVLNISLKYGF